MGIYLNTGNEGFRTILNSTYVDKTGLIAYINSTIDTPWKLTCFSRPRRFGKSFAAKMLGAYYDRSCDSEELFCNLKIADSPSFHQHLNQYDVISLDITNFISQIATTNQSIVMTIQQEMIKELKAAFPNCINEDEIYLPKALLSVSQKTRRKFFIIIDEWDALFREKIANEALQKEYLLLLRGLFKSNTITDQTIAGAYMTGILPIKKYGTQSALTDFREFTMVRPAKLAEFIGFTEAEVQALCEQYQMDYQTMRRWYDGYSFNKMSHVYSPNSVMNAIHNAEYANYWTSSETYESLKQYISMNFDGLKDTIIQILGGAHIPIVSGRFQNDMSSLDSRDDILTLLVHLGYLAYDEEEEEVYLPNLEVADAFKNAVEGEHWHKIAEALSASKTLLKNTLDGNADAVASALDEIHSANTSVLQYNDENSLSCALTIAYYAARKDYEIIRELPAGKGFADLVFIPYRDVNKPAIVIELKYNHDAAGAIEQIKNRNYAGRLLKYTGKVLLVGINYAKNDPMKKHHCIIESFSKTEHEFTK